MTDESVDTDHPLGTLVMENPGFARVSESLDIDFRWMDD